LSLLKRLFVIGLSTSVLALLVACGSSEIVIQTVVVEKEVAGETVVETVIVEKEVAGETVVETVVVEKEVVVTPTSVVALPTAIPEKINIPAPKSAIGELVMLPINVAAGIGLNNSGAPEAHMDWGVSEQLFRVEGDDLATPWLAESWDVSSDGLQVTVKIRSGIQFHKGWGELRAEDIAWSINDTNSVTTPTSIHSQAGDLAAFVTSASATDDRTLVINFSAFDPRWNTAFFNMSRAGDSFGIYSKKAFDEKGADWVRDNTISTGPYEVVSWIRQDSAELVATGNHWKENGSIPKIILLDIPEVATRVAMLKTGEADWSEMSVRDIRPLTEAGFGIFSTGNRTGFPVNFAGNYWETNAAKTGEELARPTMVHDQPWIGNPFNPRDNNPAGMDDMEQARLVRTALSMSIDRDLVNEAVYGGLATPYYIGMFHVNSPEWQSKWEVKYDPVAAGKLLDQAGYPLGDDGVRFEMPLYGFSNNRDWAETADSVSGFFDAVGVKTTVVKSVYTIVRPALVGRTNTTPATQSCRSDKLVPWDWVRGEEETSLTRGGFGCHMESPEILRIVRAVAAERDVVKRIALNNELAQYMFDQALKVGVIALPFVTVANPQSISDWPMTLGSSPSNSPEKIKSAR